MTSRLVPSCVLSVLLATSAALAAPAPAPAPQAHARDLVLIAPVLHLPRDQVHPPELEALARRWFDEPLTFDVPTLPVPAVRSDDRGDIWVFHDDEGTLVPNGFTFANGLQVDRLLREMLARFYFEHSDKFEFVVILSNFNVPNFLAAYLPLSNDTRGIGYRHSFPQEVFDNTPTRLEGFLLMNNFRNYTGGFGRAIGHFTFAQELGHRWGAFVRFKDGGRDSTALLGRDSSHWNFFFNSDNSALEGNRWLDLGDGRFRTRTTLTDPLFSMLDLYLMGLAAPSEVPATFLIEDPEVPDGVVGIDGGPLRRASPPLFDTTVTIRGTRKDVTLDDIIASEGERRPTHETAPRELHAAFVLLQRQRDVIGNRELRQIDEVRRFFEEAWEFDARGRANLVTNIRGVHGQWNERCETAAEDPADCDATTTDACVDLRSGRRQCARRCETDADCGTRGRGRCCETATLRGAAVKICQYDYLCPGADNEPTPTATPAPTEDPGGFGQPAGATCSAEDSCALSLVCVARAGQASGVCRVPCSGGGGDAATDDCPALYDCRVLSETSGACIPQEGNTCMNMQECAVGLRCIAGAGASAGRCREVCDPAAAAPGCGRGFACRALGEGGVCVPGGGGGGSGCSQGAGPAWLAAGAVVTAALVIRRRRRSGFDDSRRTRAASHVAGC